MSLAPTRHSPLAPVLTLLALTLTPRPSLIRCVLAEASAAGGDKAKAACVADKVWALTLALTLTLTLALALTLTLTPTLALTLTLTFTLTLS